MSLHNLVNVDNQKLLLHKKELINYLKEKKNKLITIEVDLALACNHKCPNCTFGDRPNNVFLDSSVMEKIIRSLPETGAKGMIISGGGEPTIHKGLGAFIRKVSKADVDVTLTTNGQLIHKHFEDIMRNLKRIRFSIDAASHKTFKHTHGKDQKTFDLVIGNLKKTIEFKKENALPIDIGVSFLICEENAYELFHAIDFYKKTGVDFLHFKPMQLCDNNLNRYYHKNYPVIKEIASKINDFNSSRFRVSISREKFFQENDFNIQYHKCHGSYFDMIIGADGKAYTCCHFKYNPDYCYGDLHNEEITTILNKVKANVTDDCFPDCKMDAVNQFIEYSKGHINDVENMINEVGLSDLKLGDKWL
jgi:molybdenum cofactor biosynthesis enzyme MoaA